MERRLKQMEDVLNEFFENTWEEDYWDYAIPLSRKDIQSIVEYDTSFGYKKELNAYGREPLWLKAHKIPDFLELEREFSIELNPRIKEYFSVWWHGEIRVKCKNLAVTTEDIYMWMRFLKCPSDIHVMIQECKSINNELKDDTKDFYLPIGVQKEAEKYSNYIVVSNREEAVYLMEQNKSLIRLASSIEEFYLKE